MLQKTIHRLLRHRHFWRDVSFSELSEIYASMLLRSLATSLIGIFVPIYLYKQGYSLQGIFLYYTVFFIARIFLDIAASFLVGRIGPKHTIVLSTLATIIHFSMLLTIQNIYWPLGILAVVNAIAASLFFIAFHTDFSKVKDSRHGGKELGYLTIMQNIGGIIGPLLGGIIATVFDARYTITLAIVVMVISLVPLFRTKEPVKLHQHITYKGFEWRKHKRELVSYAFFNTENMVCILVWTLYIALVVFTTGTYAKLGAVTAVSIALSLTYARIIGGYIDKKGGRRMLVLGIRANALVHIARIFVVSPLAVLGVNIINEPITATYRMPYTKQFYDFTDSVPGYRIVFIAIHEAISQACKAILLLFLLIASYHMDAIQAMKILFVVAAFLSLGIALQPKGVNNQ